MFEITIKDTVYQFKFGLGFVREIDKTQQQKLDNGAVQNMGLQYAVASIIDEDPIALVDILEIANKTEKPRVSRAMLDEYIEDENTDLDKLFKDVLDFFERSNSTKKKTAQILELVEKEKAKAKTES